MDVKNVGQNSSNLNVYSSNLSEYTQTSNDTAVPQTQQVQKVEAQTLVDNNTKKQEYSKKELDNALKKIDGFLKDEHTHTEYAYHKDFHTLMIKIIDDNTKEVILEVPPKKILDMVASMCRQFGLFDKKA